MTQQDLPFLPEFFDRYIALTDDNQPLIEQLSGDKNLYTNLRDELISFENFKYQPNKWTSKQVFQHVIDTEKILNFRALSIARGDSQNLPGFDENAFANEGDARNRTIDDLLEEFEVQRTGSIHFYRSLTNEMLLKEGLTNGIKITPLAIGLVVVGHPRHHLKVLKERYFIN